MMKQLLAVVMAAITLGVFAKGEELATGLLPNPWPVPVFRPAHEKPGERPVAVDAKSEAVAENGLYRRVETTITFTNPNHRVFEGELEFPLPDGATVCGYALDVNGTMVPGVICPKEQARVAFENEKRKGIDPGVVEHVKGNLWKTRIYPLMPNTPRKAMVAYLEPLDGEEATVAEKDPESGEIFVAVRGKAEKTVSIAEKLRAAEKAVILWDASYSRLGKVATDRARLELLPENGEWTLIVFRNVAEAPKTFTARAELLKAIDAVKYDGGTAFAALPTDFGVAPVFVFTDETDTLSPKAPDLEKLGFVFASRPDGSPRKIVVRKAKDGENVGNVGSGKLLATAWAANRIADLASQADARKDEFLELGRKYGVASPVTSLIVLERLDQYLEYRIEPPKTLAFHDEWVKQRAAADDAIADEKTAANHRALLLSYWEDRVKWWNDPIPPKLTPKSGVFDIADAVGEAPMTTGAGNSSERRASSRAMMPLSMSVADDGGSMARSGRRSAMSAAMDYLEDSEEVAPRAAASVRKRSAAANSAAPSVPQPTAATIKLAAWDPKMPYLKAISGAAYGYAYDTYLQQRDVYGNAPSFYLDCAGWFFKAKESALGCRVISTLAELKLEDVGMWRTMGWRLREAGEYDAAVNAFRHVFEMRPEESQSRRDLALVLAERGKLKFSAADLTEAARLYKATAFTPTARRSGRHGNDMQSAVFALEELNGLLAWCKANADKVKGFTEPELDAAFRRDLPVALRITLAWDTDETDIDLHILEPNGEEAFYGHRLTSMGGFVSEDVTTGYGPEEYLAKDAQQGVYKIKVNYFASRRQQLTGAATVTATVYTDWGKPTEKREIMSLRLDKQRDKHAVGEVVVGER